MRQAFAGLLWTKQFYHYDVERLARRRPGAAAAAGRAPRAAATASGRTSTTPTSSRCRTSGSTRGTRPGTSPSTASRWRWSIRSSPRSSCSCCCASGTCTRTASSPPTSGRSATSTRRSTPGRPGASTRSNRSATGTADRDFLERVFHKLLLNFTWWVNRKDAEGNNVFQGGFLGLDNIGVFDRIDAAADRRPSRAVRRHELDGDVLPEHAARSRWSWPRDDPAYEDVASKFFEHFLYIAHAMNTIAATTASGCGTRRTASSTTCCTCRTARGMPLKVRSMVGLIPLFAVETLEPELLDRLPGVQAAARVVHRATGRT